MQGNCEAGSDSTLYEYCKYYDSSSDVMTSHKTAHRNSGPNQSSAT